MPASFLESFQKWAKTLPDKLAYDFVDHRGEVIETYTYSALFNRCYELSRYLVVSLKICKGDRVLLVFPPSLDFIVTYLACLMNGIIAVPVFPPDPFQNKKDTQVFLSILKSSGATVVLTSAQYRRAVDMANFKKSMFNVASSASTSDKSSSASVNFLTLARWEVLDTSSKLARDDYKASSLVFPGPEELAFLQYTSGSTSEPKGVMVSHGNLAHNLSLIKHCGRATQQTICISWLPQYHDMGLIGPYLSALYSGATGIMMSPISFIKNPILWVTIASKYKGTLISAPNFAYQITARKFLALPEDHPLKSPASSSSSSTRLDLSSLTQAWNGAEPIDAATLDLFCSTFLPYGYNPAVMNPAYGLAEHTLFVSGSGKQRLTVDKAALERNIIQPIILGGGKGKGGEEGVLLVGCGQPSASCEDLVVKIVEPETCRVLATSSTIGTGRVNEGPILVGEIWVDSPSKAKGYWSLPEKTQADFYAQVAQVAVAAANDGGQDEDDNRRRYLRTGDLGFLYQGELFICGRLKDLIILQGKNYYPQDIEATARDYTLAKMELRKGCTAAFGQVVLQQESIVFVGEVADQSMAMIQQLQAKAASNPARANLQATYEAFILGLRQEIQAAHGVSLQFVGLLPPRTIPKTSSGKIARQWVKNAFLEGALPYLFTWNGGLHGLEDEEAAVATSSATGGSRGSRLTIQPGERIDPQTVPLEALMLDIQAIIEDILHLSNLCSEEPDQPTRQRVYPPIAALGLDSAQGVQFRQTLAQRYTIALSNELLHENDVTILTLARYLHRGGGPLEHRPVLLEGSAAWAMGMKRLPAATGYTGQGLGQGKSAAASSSSLLLPAQFLAESAYPADIDTGRYPTGCCCPAVATATIEATTAAADDSNSNSSRYYGLVWTLLSYGLDYAMLGLLIIVGIVGAACSSSSSSSSLWLVVMVSLIAVYYLGLPTLLSSMLPTSSYMLRLKQWLVSSGLQATSHRVIIEAPIASYATKSSPCLFTYAPYTSSAGGTLPPLAWILVHCLLPYLLLGREDCCTVLLPAGSSLWTSLLASWLMPVSALLKQLLLAGSSNNKQPIQHYTERKLAAVLSAGQSAAIAPGGQEEAAQQQQQQQVNSKKQIALVQQTRKQFIKVALQQGAQVVPLFTFTAAPAASSGKSATTGSLLTVIGRPLLCPKGDAQPSLAMINEYHERYLREVKRIFETYKNMVNQEDCKITFLSG